MKDKMDSIRMAMHTRGAAGPKTVSQPVIMSEQQPIHAPKPKTELKAETKPEYKNEPRTDPLSESNYEPEPEPKSEPEQTYNPAKSLDQDSTESFVIQRVGTKIPDLEFGCLEEDTVVHCQEGSVPAPSLLLALLAPWLGTVLQAGRGQDDTIRNILCPDLRADSLTRFLAEVAAMKEEIYVDEDVRSVFLMNFALRLKENMAEFPEVKIKELTVEEETKDMFVESKANTEERKAIQLKSRNKYKANILSKLEKVCKCDLKALNDNQKIKHYKVAHDIYEKCQKCSNLYMKIFDEVHVCKSQKTVPKKINSACSVCGKRTHREEYHSTTPATCEHCGKTFRNLYTAKCHSYGCTVEMPCPICGKFVKKMKIHTNLCHTSDSEKKFKCEHCGKGFLEKKSMESHTNMHLKLKPHKCRKGCELGFADPANRGQHEKRVHKEHKLIIGEKLE